MSGRQAARTGAIILSACDGIIDTSAAEEVERRLRVTGGNETPAIALPYSPDCPTEIKRFIERNSLARIVIGGCLRGTYAFLEETLAGDGILRGNIDHVRIPPPLQTDNTGPFSNNELFISGATRSIRTALLAARNKHPVDTVSFRPDPAVAVLGDDRWAHDVARNIASYGHPTTLISSSELRGPDHPYRTITGADEVRIRGAFGEFRIEIGSAKDGAAGTKTMTCGAVVDTRCIVRGVRPEADLDAVVEGELNRICATAHESGRLIDLSRLEQVIGTLPRLAGTRTVAIVLDFRLDETRASMAEACRIAIDVLARGNYSVHILCRHVRIASPDVNALYDTAREAGVTFCKYDSEPEFLDASTSPGRTSLRCTDAILGTELQFECDLIAMSRFGLVEHHSDSFVNNPHFAPTRTAIPGYFIAGTATGEWYAPLTEDACMDAVLQVHELLRDEVLTIECTTASIDEEKCAACLTCIRSCPHGAMRIDTEKNIACNISQSCRRCGICVGVCPARAITLPEYGEDVLLTILG